MPELRSVPSAGRASRLLPLLLLLAAATWARAATVEARRGPDGVRLLEDGRELFVKGVNWDYFPVGTNYNYSLWTQPDDFVREALDREMALLQAMGANAIRVYAGMPARWVRYVYERWGMRTIVNHSFGRYGLTIDGAWTPVTDYSDPRTRELLLAETRALADEYRGTPGLLLWLLGNENNYGLEWKSAETADIPAEQVGDWRARRMYSLFGEAVAELKRLDPDHPVAIANGDLQHLAMIRDEIPQLDVFGTNIYRGVSFGDAFRRVEDELGLPILFTEFGADAFDALRMRENQLDQARFLIGQWREIYANAAGGSGAGNAVGGLVFQFSDGWWKYKQTANLDVHDTNASWSNGGYPWDYREGRNNMNEEWWGICAKGPTDERGFYELYPRAAYYALERVFAVDPGPGASRALAAVTATEAATRARGDAAALETSALSKVRVSGLRLEFESILTGGSRVSTPDEADPSADGYPTFRGFDRLESYYVDFEARPAGNVRGELSLNILGHVPENPIDEIFYENRGRTKTVPTSGQPLELTGLERVRVHHASASWQHEWFDLEAFHRAGHYHWGYEGDFFGLYREANDGPNIDVYNGEAPSGMELTGRRALDGVKLAVGPELWWGANPAALLKVTRAFGGVEATVVYQEDLDDAGAATSPLAVPVPPTRKATLHLATEIGHLGVELGGIWSGDDKVGRGFQLVDGGPGAWTVLEDRVRAADTFGGKARLTWQRGRLNWYAQAAAMGLVADGGPTAIQTFTGWRLADSGSGNQINAMTGLTWLAGDLQVAPNVLWQKPIEGPVPADAPSPARPRNILDDPFAVRANREMLAGELLLTWDPTPATWMYEWNSDEIEDAPLAASLGAVYRHLPTTMDAAIGILEDGRTPFAFPGATPARDLWEIHARVVSKRTPGRGWIALLSAGVGEPNGDDARAVHGYAAEGRWLARGAKLALAAKVDMWGPYDYHRDFNLTYPLQLVADGSLVLGAPAWWEVPTTRLGLTLTWRSLDERSPRYCPGRTVNALGVLECDPELPGAADGSEWEVRTYLHLSI